MKKIVKEIACKWEESCVCNSDKDSNCFSCRYYFMIDSGYGYCRALPEPTVVAWCKDICSFFNPELSVIKEGGKEE